MTTVFGISVPETKMALLVGDRQSTTMDGNGKPSGKYLEGRKLWLSDDKLYAFGHSGRRDQNLFDLAEAMKTGKIDISKVIQDGSFKELRELNLSRLGDKIPELDTLSGFLVITRKDGNPALYTCFPMGAVEPRSGTSIGSGEKRVSQYMDSLSVLGEARKYLASENNKPTRADIIRAGLEAVRYAQSRDIYSSGLDLIAMTPTESFDCLNVFHERFNSQIKKIVKMIGK